MSVSLGAAVRGCGKRVAGGIYAECPLSPGGVPIEHFLIEPPVKVDPNEIGLSPIGVKLIEREGETHVLDWVGGDGYPNVADFVEEVRHLGLSRRLPKTMDFKRITNNSMIVLLHERAWIAGWRGLLLENHWTCPKERPEHAFTMRPVGASALVAAPGPVQCIGAWWYDLEPNLAPGGTRAMPAFTYHGHERTVETAPHALAIFASFPIHRIAVVRDREGGTHEEAVEKASQSGLAVIVEEE